MDTARAIYVPSDASKAAVGVDIPTMGQIAWLTKREGDQLADALSIGKT